MFRDADAKNAVICPCFSYASTAQNRNSTTSHLMKSLKRILLPAVFFSSIYAGSVYAGERWYVSATANGMAGNYSGSELRDSFYSASAWLNVDYLDYYSVALAYTNLKINFKDADAGEFDITQDAFAGRFQYYFYLLTLQEEPAVNVFLAMIFMIIISMIHWINIIKRKEEIVSSVVKHHYFVYVG